MSDRIYGWTARGANGTDDFALNDKERELEYYR